MADFQAVVRRVQATVTMIPLTKPSLKRGFSSIIVEAKHQDLILPDNLILHCILDHATEVPECFEGFPQRQQPRVLPDRQSRRPCKAGGIDKYFSEAKNALGWYRSRPAP